MKKLLSFILMVVILLTIACGHLFNHEQTQSDFDNSGTLQLTIRNIPSTVSTAKAYVYADDIDTIISSLVKNDTQITGTVSNIPVGTNRYLKIDAFNSNDTVIYKGISNPFSVYENKTTNVSMELFAVTGNISINGTVIDTDIWRIKTTTIPTARFHLVSTVYDNKIYVLGGGDSNGQPYAKNEVYDPIADTSYVKASMPVKTYLGAAVTVNDKIYVIGGWNSTSHYLSTVQEYDPSLDQWSVKSPISLARSGIGAATVNGKIYVFGGFDNPTHYNTVEEYDSSTDQWTIKNSMPTARSSMGITVVNKKIYLVGGYNSSGNLSSIDIYDPSTDQWESGPLMSRSIVDPIAKYCNNEIFVIGGTDSAGNRLKTVEAYNLAEQQWKTKRSMNIVHITPAAGVVNGKIYIISGTTNGWSDAVDIIEEYTP